HLRDCLGITLPPRRAGDDPGGLRSRRLSRPPPRRGHARARRAVTQSAREGGELVDVARGCDVLRLDPQPLARTVSLALALRDHAFEATLAHDVEQHLSVRERRHDAGKPFVERERLEKLAPLTVALQCCRLAVEREHVERHVRNRDVVLPVQHPRAEPVEVGVAVAVEGDQLAVELHVGRQRLLELGQERRHVPAATAAGAEAAVRADEAAKAVELRFEAPPRTGGDRARAREHRFWQPQHQCSHATPVGSEETRGATARSAGLSEESRASTALSTTRVSSSGRTRTLRVVTSVTGYHYKALRFIGLAGKSEQAMADEYGSRRPLEIEELVAAGLVREATVSRPDSELSGEAAADEVVVYSLTPAGAEAAGLDADTTGHS